MRMDWRRIGIFLCFAVWLVALSGCSLGATAPAKSVNIAGEASKRESLVAGQGDEDERQGILGGTDRFTEAPPHTRDTAPQIAGEAPQNVGEVTNSAGEAPGHTDDRAGSASDAPDAVADSAKSGLNVSGVISTDAGSDEDSDRAHAMSDSSEDATGVSITIVGPEDIGTILTAETIPVNQGETVLDVLIRVTKENKIPMSFKGRKSAAYIEGIDNLYEFDRGPGSGWMYRVNDAFPNKSAGAYKVSEGDEIYWLFTLDFGQDIGATGANKKGE